LAVSAAPHRADRSDDISDNFDHISYAFYESASWRPILIGFPDQQEVPMRNASIILVAIVALSAPVAGAQEKGATPQDVV